MEGTLLGSCRILSELGSGGMGTVYRAELVQKTAGLMPGEAVAVKVIHPHLLETPGFFKRFLREAQIGQQVHHENVVRTYDCDAVRKDGTDHHFLVMEFVDGQTLRSLRQELKRVPEELCRHIGHEVARGLQAIHATGVIHRDLKPENVLITNDQVVKVMDLGVARLQDEIIRLSQSGHFVGSLEYAAPEQFRGAGADADARTDLYALGVLLYELATGQHPYRDEDPRKVLRRILDEEPRRAGEVNPQLSPFFEEVVHRLLDKAPDGRFASAAELAGVLAEGERSAWWSARAHAMRLETRKPLRRIRIPRDTALYGRDEDLEKLHGLFERAQRGHGQVLLVEGEAGIGKTRLVDEFVGRLRQDGEDVNFLFGSYPPGGAATAAGALSTAYREHFGTHGLETTLRGYLGGNSLLVPGLAAVLRGEGAPEDAEVLTKDSLQTVFVRVTRALAAERPTIVLIEDLHFAPEDGRALFASLALAAPGSRVLLVGTTRRGLPPAWTAQIERLDHATKYVLARLGPKDLVKLLEEAFRSERLAHELAASIAVKSDGNPLFTFEIIRGLREGQLITQSEDGRWSSSNVIEKIRIPSRVLDLIQARIADTSEEERDLLGVASCCGFEFDATLVGDAIGMARIPTLKLFARIEKKHALVRCVGERFVFDHHQIQEALYGALPPPLAREYHTALAEALERRARATGREPETLDGATALDLCQHHLRGTTPREGLQTLDTALQHLLAGYLNGQAVALLDGALETPDLVQGGRRLDLLNLKAQRLELLGRREQERAALDEAIELAAALGDRQRHAEMQALLGWHLSRAAEYEEAQRILGQVNAFARETRNPKLEAMAIGNLGLILHRMGRYGEARRHHERHLELSRGLASPQGEAKALGNLGLVYHRLGDLDAARAHHEEALRIARECGSRLVEGLATGNLGAILLDLGRYDEAQAQHERQLALVREIGDRRGEVVANGNLGFVLHLQGRFDEALEHFERQMTLAREIGDRRGESLATGNLGIVYRALGRLEEARAQHERHILLATELQDRRGRVIGTGNLANVFTSLGRHGEARTHHERHLELSREIGYRKGEAIALHNLGQEALRAGDAEAAREPFQLASAIAGEVGYASLVADAALAQAELADRTGASEEAERRYDEAVAIAREIGAPHEIARALTAYGSFLARAGREADADAALAEAVTRAREAGTAVSIVLSFCQRAALGGRDPGPAAAALAEHGPRLEHADRMRAHFLLWQATGEGEHLREARRLLDHSLASAPSAWHASMRTQVPLHRAILADS